MAVSCTKKPLPTVIVCPDQKVFHPQFSHALTPFRHIHRHSNTVYLCLRAFAAFIAFSGLIQCVPLRTIYKKKNYFHCFYILYSVHFDRINCTFVTPTSASLYIHKCNLISLLHVSAPRQPQAAFHQDLKLTKI